MLRTPLRIVALPALAASVYIGFIRQPVPPLPGRHLYRDFSDQR